MRDKNERIKMKWQFWDSFPSWGRRSFQANCTFTLTSSLFLLLRTCTAKGRWWEKGRHFRFDSCSWPTQTSETLQTTQEQLFFSSNPYSVRRRSNWEWTWQRMAVIHFKSSLERKRKRELELRRKLQDTNFCPTDIFQKNYAIKVQSQARDSVITVSAKFLQILPPFFMNSIREIPFSYYYQELFIRTAHYTLYLQGFSCKKKDYLVMSKKR